VEIRSIAASPGPMSRCNRSVQNARARPTAVSSPEKSLSVCQTGIANLPHAIFVLLCRAGGAWWPVGLRIEEAAPRRLLLTVVSSEPADADPNVVVGRGSKPPSGDRTMVSCLRWHDVDMAKLDEYRRRRDPARTSEPMPTESMPTESMPTESMPTESEPVGDSGNSFVIQEHHATALHWDFRLERNGVLVSWAIPKGLPPDPKVNHLAVQTEDHPLEYATFAGDIAHGEYGGGRVSIWDHGHYELEKWTDREIKFVLSGQRSQGRFVLIHTGGKQWLIHRMDAPARPDWQPLPAALEPMQATPGQLPGHPERWAYEMNWGGDRAIVRIEGGRVRVLFAGGSPPSAANPQLRSLGASLGTIQLLLDGELVRFEEGPVQGTYLIYDLLHHDGRSLLGRPYRDRREQLEQLGLAGAGWQTPPAFLAEPTAARAASAELGLTGVIAKRLTSKYEPGTTSSNWIYAM
jgi:bifunctional non-homologous end joining protein LigD